MTDRIDEEIGAAVQEQSADEIIAAARARRAARTAPHEQAPAIPAPKAEEPRSKLPIDPVAGLRALKPAADDVAGGVVEAPGAVAHGMIDAVNSTITLADDAGDALGRLTNFNPTFYTYEDEGGERKFDFTITQEARERTLAELRSVLGRDEFGRLPTIPNIAPNQDTTTGKMVESMAQFLTGFAGGGRALRSWGVLQNAGKATQVGKAVVQGAVADFAVFDGHEDRLSDLIEAVPGLRNPVTAFLASNEDDPEVVGRLKNVLEGGALGVATDAFLAGLRSIRGGRTMKTKAAAEEATEQAAKEQFAREASDYQAEFERVYRAFRGGKDEVIDPSFLEDATSGPGNPDEFMENVFSRLETDDGVKGALDSLMQKDLPGIDDARRGKQKQTLTRIKATKSEQQAFDDLIGRRKGEALNAEEIDAARQLLVVSGRRVLRAANELHKADSPGARAGFVRVLEQHRMVQQEMMGARAEAGRALAAFNMTVKDAERFMLDQETMMNAFDPGMAKQAAENILKMGPDNIHKMSKALMPGIVERTSDVISEYFRNAWLSSPRTHIANLFGNMNTILGEIAEMGSAGKLARLIGDDEIAEELLTEVAPRIAGIKAGVRHQFVHLTQTISDAFRATGDGRMDALRNIGFDDLGVTANKVDAKEARALRAEKFGVENNVVATSINAIGSVMRLPQHALSKEDDFFKGINFMSEIHGLAHRQALKEVRAGSLPREQMAARMAELVDEPPQFMRKLAREAAERRTFTNPASPDSIIGTATRGARDIRNGLNRIGLPIGHYFLPFVMTPANIFRYTLQRSPLAPMSQQWRQMYAAGGRDRYTAITQVALGTSAVFLGADYAAEGLATGSGPSDPDQRAFMQKQFNFQPNSVRIGDTYVRIDRLDPHATFINAGAALHEIFANTEFDDDDEDAFTNIVESIASTGNLFLSKSYMTGAARVIEALGDPERRDLSFAQAITGSLVPSIAYDVRTLTDPYMRDIGGSIDGLRKRSPLLSEGLPPQHDLWGRERRYQSFAGQLYNAISPLSAKIIDPEPIDEELNRLGFYPEMPPRVVHVPLPGEAVGNVKVSLKSRPDIYQDLVQLAGNEVKIFGGLGAKDYLNQFVQSSDYAALGQVEAPGADPQADAIRKVISASRQAAKKELYRRHRHDLTEMARANLAREEAEKEARQADEAAAVAMELIGAE